MYCPHCGSQIFDGVAVCPHCGFATGAPASVVQPVKDDTMTTVIKVFMIIGCVSIGWSIIPLAWCIPMTISVFNSLKNGQPISMAMKICVLLFVSMVAGICMLCMDDSKARTY